MALVNPIVYRLPFRRNWIYRDNLFFAPSLYSSVTGGAYFLPYIFKRLFEQRQFRDIETYFSHFLVKRFNNNILYYQFFIQSRFFNKAREAFQKEFFPHMFRHKRISGGRGGIFRNYQLLSLLRKKHKKIKRLSSNINMKVVSPSTNRLTGTILNPVKGKKVTLVKGNECNDVKEIGLKNMRHRAASKGRNLLPSERVIGKIYNELLMEKRVVTPFRLTKANFVKHCDLLKKLKLDINKSRVILKEASDQDSVKNNDKKGVRLVSYFNKKTMPLGARLRRKWRYIVKRKRLLQLDKQRLIAFQTLLRFFEYYTRHFVFNHYKATVLKTLSSYFQNQKHRYIIDFRFLSLRAQNIYQMLRFMTSRLAQGGNIKQLIRSTQRFYETKGVRSGMNGVKLVCSGRFSRQQRAQRLILTSGKVPSNTISAKIDYAVSTSRLKYGASTIKMWLSYE